MRLAYDAAGSGPAVVLLHNGLCDRRMWDRQMETFATGSRVVRCDLPGYGDVPYPDGPYSSAEDVLAVLDELAIERAVVVGNSIGGRVAADICLTAPDRVTALVLVCAGRAGWEWSEPVRDSWRRQDAAAESGDLDLAVELSLQLWLDGPQRPPGAVRGGVRGRVAQMCRRALEHELAATSSGAERRPEGSPDAIRVPTLILHGDLDVPDIAAIAEAYEREIPGARRVAMHGAAHIPSLELPEEFDGLVLGFLREAVTRPAAGRP